MKWARIFIGGRSDMHIIRKGKLMALRYAELPYSAAVGDLLLLIQNKARHHTAIFVENITEAAEMQRTGEYFPPLQFTCRNCGGGDRGHVAIYRPFGEVSLSLNRTVTCMVLKANDRRTSCPCHDEFRGPRSDYVRQVALATTTTTTHQ
ncbi:uncharacterized protein TNCV_2381711 [Trichonephila clavipes]|nr:uncharacterized protein TNCV_2381711 [Trichonephila clavipes]